MPKVTFAPQGLTVEARPGDSLFDLARSAGLQVDTACVGQGTCGLCRVRVIAGADALSPYNPLEERHLGNVYHLTRVRLSCQSLVYGDVTVEIVHKRKKRRR